MISGAVEQANMQAHWQGGLLFYSFPHFDVQKGLAAVFSSRLGGVSEGGCATLNLAFLNPQQPPEPGRENLRRFARAVGFDENRLVITQQTHTVNIFEAAASDAGRGITRPRGYTDIDGLFTQAENLPLLTFHADCVPLFFYAPIRRMVGVAHAGWRGTIQNIAGVMVAALVERGCAAQEIRAAIGPSAGPCCYQIGPEVARLFAPLADEQGPLYIPDKAPGKFLLDLWRANRALLLAAGLLPENITIGGLCTVCHPEIFYSHRVQGNNRGTMAAMIMLT